MKKLLLGLFAVFLIGAVFAALPAYIIQGDKVYFDDPRVYMAAEPHTLDRSGWVELTLQPKTFTGDVNILFGFNSSMIKAKNPQYWYEGNQSVMHALTCDDNGIIAGQWYNYTINPKIAYCWRNSTNGTELVWSHAFESANLTIDTIYWYEQVPVAEWRSIGAALPHFTLNYDGKDTWYYATNIPFTAGQARKLRIMLEVTPFSGENKYDFAAYPSSYGATFNGLAAAVADGNLYLLDPWTTSSLYTASFTADVYGSFPYTSNASLIQESITNGLVLYYTFDDADTSGGTVAVNSFAGNANGSIRTPSVVPGATGKLGQAYNFTKASAGAPSRVVNVSNSVVGDLSTTSGQTFCQWLYRQPGETNAAKQIFMYSDGSDSILGEFDSTGANLYLTGNSGTANYNCNSFGGLTTGVWTHVCVVKETNNSLTVYKNGTQTCLGETNTWNDDSYANTGVGRADAGAANYAEYSFAGLMDEIAWWSRALTPSDITKVYNGGLGVTYPFNATFQSTNFTLNVSVSQFKPVWKGNASSVNISFDGGANYVAATNNTVTSWSQATKNLFQYRVKVQASQTFSDFTVQIDNLLGLVQQNITPSTPYQSDTLQAYLTCQNGTGSLTGYVQWYNGTAAYSTVQSASVSNNTAANIANITASLHAIGENWTAEAWCGDGTFNTTKQNVSIIIQDGLPVISGFGVNATNVTVSTGSALYTVNCTAYYGVTAANVSITDPNTATTTYVMSSTDNTTWTKSYTPAIEGVFSATATCYDPYLGSSTSSQVNFTASAAEGGATECGNNVTEVGEACDNGADNGACPATCSATCTINSCTVSGGGGGGGRDLNIVTYESNASFDFESPLIDKGLFIKKLFNEEPSTFYVTVPVSKIAKTCTAEEPLTCRVVNSGNAIEITYIENLTTFFSKVIVGQVSATSQNGEVTTTKAQFRVINLEYSILGDTDWQPPDVFSDFPYIIRVTKDGYFGGVRVIAIATIVLLVLLLLFFTRKKT